MKIHGHNTVGFHDEGCLGRADPDTGRLVTVVTEYREIVVLDCFGTA